MEFRVSIDLAAGIRYDLRVLEILNERRVIRRQRPGATRYCEGDDVGVIRPTRLLFSKRPKLLIHKGRCNFSQMARLIQLSQESANGFELNEFVR